MKTTYGKKQKKGQSAEKKSAYWLQLIRLLVCMAVFLVVFIGKEVWPSKVAETGKQLLVVIRSNTDFRAAFANLGKALSPENSILEELGEFCVSVFARFPDEETQFPVDFSQEATPQTTIDDTHSEQLCSWEESAVSEEKRIIMKQELSVGPKMQVGDVVQSVEYQGEELPEDYSEQWLYLGEMEMVTPVMGKVTSQFGYRDHPTIGRYAPHGGVDIAADRGTTVVAFSAGTVVAMGNSEDFGLWLQLKHQNGVTTFYSHCSKLCVEKGERVQAGQTVARVGSTGNSTGPHLHFEIKLNGVRLDPMHYIKPGQIV